MSCAGNVYVRVCERVCVLSLPVHPCAPKGFPLTPCQAMVCVPPCGDARAVFKNNICMQNVWIHGDNKNVDVRTRVTPAGTRPTFPPPRFAWVRVRSCVCDIRAHWLVWPCLCAYELPFACTSASVFVRAICPRWSSSRAECEHANVPGVVAYSSTTSGNEAFNICLENDVFMATVQCACAVHDVQCRFTLFRRPRWVNVASADEFCVY